MDGFLNLNKPAGFTSHDCVAKLRRSLKLKRIGHAGTLDPAATGVLPMAIGRATRLLQFLPGEKAYRAVIRFGITTTTDDLEGEVLRETSADALTLSTVEAALRQFEGRIEQLPPSYSAVQVDGKRLYDLARTGQEISVKPRTVEVFDLQVQDWRPGDFAELEVDIRCGAGTYIRAIARDLGQMLQVGGCLASLLRTASSGFDLAASLTLEAVETAMQQSNLPLIAPEIALRHLDKMVLSDAIARRWCLGQRIAWADLETEAAPTQAICIYHASGQFLGIGQRQFRQDGFVLAPEVVYAPVEMS
jgi:tRNA pseudouridine55 synthase